MMAPGTRPARLARSAWRRIPGPPRDLVRARLLRLYRDLLRRFGPQGWWPGRTPFEIAVGAILTQHTAWSQAARAVAALRARGRLSARALAAAPEAVIAEAIRPAGTYRLKARRLRDFTAWLLARFGGRFEGMRRAALGALRRVPPPPRPARPRAAAVKLARRWCGARRPPHRSRSDLQQQVGDAVGGVGDGERARALAHLFEPRRVRQQLLDTLAQKRRRH